MRLSVIYIFIAMILMVSGCATAQRNLETVEVEGTKYYVHEVEKGNTLYGISRQYSIDVSELMVANPGSKSGLKVGERILIPVKKVDRRELRRSDISQKGDSLFHTVQKKETLFSISQQYNVPVNALKEANPGSGAGIQTGERIFIPVEKIERVESQFRESARHDSLKLHTVNPGETLFSIARMYDVDIDTLREVNSQLGGVLKAGTSIRIPKLTDRYKKKLKEEKQKKEAAADTLPKPNPLNTMYRVALMLPFNLDEADSLLNSSYRLNNPNLNALTRVSLDYYRGTRMALDSLKKLGFKVKLYVYEVQDVVDADQVIKRPELGNMHLLIGPMHKAALAVVSEHSRKLDIPLVSPNALMGRVIEDNPLLITPAAGPRRQMQFLVEEIKKRHARHKVILVNSESNKDARYRMAFRSNYEATGDSGMVPGQQLHELIIGKYGHSSIKEVLDKERKNVLVVPSEDLAFVSDFMTRMSQLPEGDFDVMIYGLDSWLKYDNIESSYKNRFNLRLPASGFVDYEDPHVVDFLRKYRKRFSTEPGAYDFGFTAFDMGLAIGDALKKYGPDFYYFLPKVELDGLKSDYHFVRSKDGNGFENEMVYLLEYENYEIKRVSP